MPKVLIYGDSNSFGTAPTPRLEDECVHPPGIRWGDQMAKLLGPDWTVIVEGLPGRMAVLDDPIEGAHMNGLTVMPAIVFSHRPIDIVVICLGTNDLKARFAYGAQDVALGLARLANAVLATKVVGQVLLIAPPPLEERGDFAQMFSNATERGKGLPAHLSRFADQEGAAFLDAGKHISVDPIDGIHWSADAHRDLAKAVGAKLKDMIA